MSPRPVIVVIHKFGGGGLTSAVLDQIQMFCEAGHPTTVVTFDPGTEQVPRVAGLRAAGRLHPDAEVRNIHEVHAAAWVAAREQAPHDRSGQRAPDTSGLLRLEGADGRGEYVRWFDPYGGLALTVREESVRETRVVAHHQGGTVTLRETFDKNGNVILSDECVDGRPWLQTFRAPTGDPYLVRAASPATGRGVGVVVRQPGDVGTRSVRETTYGGIPQWQTAWLQSVVDEYETPPFVVAESPSAIPKVSRLRAGSATRAGMLHNNHFDEPYREGATIRGDHRTVFSVLENLEALVVLSEPQRGHIAEAVGFGDRMYVVPNATKFPDVSHVERNPDLVTLVTRLDPMKSIDESIRAFSQVVAAVPEARLDIYGGGPDAARLERIVTQLGLDDVVRLKGKTDRPHDALAGAAVTVLTSQREAMPLGILEAHACATPVVAYDLRYGPDTLIDEGETGHVVPWGDRDALAQSLVELLRDPDAARQMGRLAQERARARNSYEAVLRSWEALFDLQA
ncbi:glycosyltransferase [Cellulomonas sp. PhB143]|uniref:glycosyltransferase n=1 Tax=Cellulomonas sp. PhB143 TaxID=2485186 RepID=UPI000F4801D9|nr:glycosyltransferase [Cellulomonas sp. PhB143]ROS78556.1 glycosyltransferase involved in cell wall biosynthesis [Cellulomonas sp. PhB143]